ncbi:MULTISPECIES: hypothetical protein [Anoxybacillus]|jgi:hypothetical protein|uniref:hypothetical protein n=1 Tax=Anoxybacillus TaxID=150247 RepID=UPI000A88C417|nr:hypothetical protein [Anoxybacillus flavithermus]ASA97447.1 hypothetical protein CA592_12240 [Anoxybacillus flavithermus]MBE2906465.1 hypothetical protein [Anoxybacillus flavithermus]MBE2908638.1 hypothetical protein [Anoxybacillus flavithermus]MBE2911488.1 hypothetical protein [Anoxybacillus flavithermus]MBE2913613.1 hypothetical protein [Anoxybacillus flavithermus]
MSKRKKLNKISLAVSSLGLTLLLGASALAASSIARIDGSHLDVSGATITVGDGVLDEITYQNNSHIDFYAMVSRDVVGLDPEVFDRRVLDYEEGSIYNRSVTNGKYYPRSKWSGESGAAYTNALTYIENN